jgi:mono/diheme cytochrome c family protein
MRALKLAVPAVALMTLMATVAGAAEPTVTAGAAAATDGKALYARRCGICHFADGGGTWMLERRLGKPQALLESRSDLQVPYIRLIARRGLNGMPRFTRVELPDSDLESIAAYLTRPGSRP